MEDFFKALKLQKFIKRKALAIVTSVRHRRELARNLMLSAIAMAVPRAQAAGRNRGIRASKIQALARGYAARKHAKALALVQPLRQEKQGSKPQADLGHDSKEASAATKLQCVMRGHRSRRHTEDRRAESDRAVAAAKSVQCVARRRLAQKQVATMKDRRAKHMETFRAAAVLLQSLYRARRAREEVEFLRETRGFEEAVGNLSGESTPGEASSYAPEETGANVNEEDEEEDDYESFVTGDGSQSLQNSRCAPVGTTQTEPHQQDLQPSDMNKSIAESLYSEDDADLIYDELSDVHDDEKMDDPPKRRIGEGDHDHGKEAAAAAGDSDFDFEEDDEEEEDYGGDSDFDL